jgi:hypothetical protein
MGHYWVSSSLYLDNLQVAELILVVKRVLVDKLHGDLLLTDHKHWLLDHVKKSLSSGSLE